MNKLITIVLTCIGFYLTASFVMWDLNPGDWNTYVRFSTAAMSLMVSGMIASAGKL